MSIVNIIFTLNFHLSQSTLRLQDRSPAPSSLGSRKDPELAVRPKARETAVSVPSVPLHVAGDRVKCECFIANKRGCSKNKHISQSELFCSSLSLTDYKQDPASGRRSARHRPHLLTDHLYKCSPCEGWWLILCRTRLF